MNCLPFGDLNPAYVIVLVWIVAFALSEIRLRRRYAMANGGKFEKEAYVKEYASKRVISGFVIMAVLGPLTIGYDIACNCRGFSEPEESTEPKNCFDM